MEPTDVKKRGRGRPRKRRREEEEVDNNVKVEFSIKKQALEMRWRPLVGRYVLKEFDDNGVFLGKIVSYDSGLYRVDYEDGDCEDLESGELRQIVLNDDYFDDDLNVRKNKLDQLVLEKSSLKKNKEKTTHSKKGADTTERSALTVNDGIQVDGDADSSSDSCEYAHDGDLEPEIEVPIIPPPQLPPSSGNIGLPEECVSHLLSVYGFLRSFNFRLFLSPFTLDDLVGAINCCVQNTLLDAIHVALMRALSHHLEMLTSDGSENASECLRCLDWSLLDSLTWPVFLVPYFIIMGHTKRLEWKDFHDDILKRGYFSSSVSRKLMILQVLCDDVLDFVEIREEIDVREHSEVGLDLDAVGINLPENGPRRVHPRYSKTSACKEREAMETITENEGTKSYFSSKYKGLEGDVSHVDYDRNSDECRLCGMDGFLLCCDGCPSAYHPRCIGVVKLNIPDGTWYCPECTINKLGPTIVAGTSLRGAEIFGVDTYEQVFLGTCNHLLVLRASASADPCLRYYSQKDISKVLQVLSSSVQHRSSYMEICKAIADYWKIPPSTFSPSDTLERVLPIANIKEDEKSLSVSVPFICKARLMATCTGDAENSISLNTSSVHNVAVSRLNAPVVATIQADPHAMLSNGDLTSKENPDLMIKKSSEQIKVESTGSTDQQVDPFDVANDSFSDRSILTTTCTSATSDGSHIGHSNASSIQVFTPFQGKDDNNLGFGMIERNFSDNVAYVGTYFKPYAYINYYMHGRYAASAAAKFAVLSSEESREVVKAANGRIVSSDILLQSKAFSAAASRFFWPSSEKKLIEVPRERCGWCHSCKTASNSKRGCMLNAAALTATKGAMKVLNSLRPVMSGEGSLPSISTYILYLGEILCGLTVGPFVSLSYKGEWRKRVEDASTLSAIVGLLLELEESIHSIALSVDWTKAMDIFPADSLMIQSAASIVGTTQRRGPGGKRHKKHSGVPDIVSKGCGKKSFVWWRGGKLLKHVFNQAILPQLVVKREARKGGLRKISGIYYVDDPELPKLSRRMVWRAAVEGSKNVSQLALQVRYLDIHVRWSDLVRPEQNHQEGKAPETEASVFRNAIICNKKIDGNKSSYCVAFGNQKHLPSRVMKNVIEMEQIADEKERYWFSETYVPLYLIKEYEEKVDNVASPPVKNPSNGLSELQRKQLKDSRRDIFLYLTSKRDKLEKCSCASCQHDVLMRNTVKCSTCQGYCHKDCIISSTSNRNAKTDLKTCKRCYNPKAGVYGNGNELPVTPLPLQGKESHDVSTTIKAKTIKFRLKPKVVSSENGNETPTAPLLGQGQGPCHTLTATKGTKVKLRNQVPSIRTQNSEAEVKQDTSTSCSETKTKNKICSWGVIWKKKSTDCGIDFRSKNIIFSGSAAVLNIICKLCKKGYDRNLMYIHCETCNGWFHTEAVEIDESKIPDVIGFKCCKCRRIRSPKCPYDDNCESEKAAGHRRCERMSKKRNTGLKSEYGAVAEFKESKPTTPMFSKEQQVIPDDDPLLLSLPKVEQITDDNTSSMELEWHGAGQGPQKLPVRRHSKPQGTVENDSFSNIFVSKEELLPVKLPVRRHLKPQVTIDDLLDDSEYFKSPVPTNGNNSLYLKEEPSCVEWPRKLPVRRYSDPQETTEGMLEKSCQSKSSMSVDRNDIIVPTEEPFCAEWDVSADGLGGGTLMDYEQTFEDMEFEPQTYFSFGELLESDEGVQLDGFDGSANVLMVSDYPSCAVSLEGFSEFVSSDPLVSTSASEARINTKHCKMCSHSEPVPDLTCKICNIVIHSHCSPWVESSSAEGNWTCGKCLREEVAK
ncbi:DDT domain-containing protein PTM-like [Mercurialis annua]|uniref:DDT domain-containing protein PTM-like n=1 Tax=Mercurialis annua TaxID=3986 RepID=UPI0021601C1D|nr:DDT domain-containing protein PTM-like [Mercurialis annua]